MHLILMDRVVSDRVYMYTLELIDKDGDDVNCF